MGWNTSPTNNGQRNTATVRCQKNGKIFRFILILFIIVFVTALFYFLFKDKGENKSATTTTKPRQIALADSSANKNFGVTSPKEPTQEKLLDIEKLKKEYVKKPGQLMLPNGKILTFPTPKEGETRKVYAYGHTYECDHLGNFKDISVRSLFHTAFEANFFALAQSDRPFIPAFLIGLDESDVRKMLEKEYQPIGDETDEEKEQLRIYDDLRATILDYMDQGGKFDDFVNDIATFQRKERESRAMGTREVMQLVKQGKVAEAKAMAEAASLMMERNGYKPILIPPHVKEAFDTLPDATDAN